MGPLIEAESPVDKYSYLGINTSYNKNFNFC